MLFQTGFIGTKAPLYLDITTICFALLPFLLLIAIKFAIKKEFKKHIISQFIILFFTIIVVLVFEIGIRLDGGFAEYSKLSSLNYNFLLSFLIIHIIISVLTVIYWIYFLLTSYSRYSMNTFSTSHKKNGKYLFLAICLTSFMGVCIYIFLFIL